MMIDVRTFFIVVVFITVLAGAWLTFSSFQQRSGRPLALWGCAYFLIAAGIALLALRSLLPIYISIVFANSMVALGYGLAWQAARAFDGRPFSWPGLFAAPALWLVACLVPVFYESLPLRVLLASLIIAAYSFATAWELWRGRRELASRLPAVILLSAHGLFFVVRAIDAQNLPFPEDGFITAFNWNMLLAFETLIFVLGMAFIAITIMKEQLEYEHRRDALTDPLTNATNRRGFELRGLHAIRRHAMAGEPIALIAFDLDNFKAVNDDFGHAMGDAILVLFSEVANRHLRASDMLFRMGGEEFICVLPGGGPEEARQVAERIRMSFAAAASQACSGRGVTVSAGVASSRDQGYDADVLAAAADRALYRSKRSGRNCVTVDGDPSPFDAFAGSNVTVFPTRARSGGQADIAPPASTIDQAPW